MSRQTCADCGRTLTDPFDEGPGPIDLDSFGMVAPELHMYRNGAEWALEADAVMVCGPCYRKREDERAT